MPKTPVVCFLATSAVPEPCLHALVRQLYSGFEALWKAKYPKIMGNYTTKIDQYEHEVARNYALLGFQTCPKELHELPLPAGQITWPAANGSHLPRGLSTGRFAASDCCQRIQAPTFQGLLFWLFKGGFKVSARTV